MNELKLPKKDRLKGLYIYCNKHKRHYSHDKVVKCKCDASKYVYRAKIHVPGTTNDTERMKFDTRDFDEVLVEFRKFKNGLINNSFQKIEINPPKKKPILLIDCMDAFMAFIKDENVPEHLKEHRGNSVIKHYKRSMKYITFALYNNNIDVTKLKFTDLNDAMVGYVYDYLKNVRGFANKTYNNHMAEMKKFERYIIREFGYYKPECFGKMKKKLVVPKIKTISIKEFEQTLSTVSYENGWHTFKKNRKAWNGRKERIDKRNFYREWLVTAFKLGLFTGGRRDEIVHMKWNGIKKNHLGKISHIEVYHFKANRKNKNLISDSDYFVKRVPMNQDFENLLMELGFNEKQGLDEYILAPHETASRETMKENITNGFSHFFSKINSNEKKQFKHLRKTYITALYLLRGDKANETTGHEGLQVMFDHYIDQNVIIGELSEMFRGMGSIFKK